MRITRNLGEVFVYHENGHCIGKFDYDSTWGKWYLRTEYAGLDEQDLKTLAKIAKRLRKEVKRF